MIRRLILILPIAALPWLAYAEEKPSDQKAMDSAKLMAGPKDDKEKVAPGAIDKDAKPEFTKTSSGLKYRILRNSKKKKPTASQTVSVHYKGWLDDKTIFDSSYRRGKVSTFPLRAVISGWTEGLQLIGEGGMIELEIPAKLGYGMRGSPPKIPPLATLHFLVELAEIK